MNSPSTATLDALFQEIGILSSSLKRASFSKADDALLVAGRTLLKVLQDQGPKSVPSLARLLNSSRQNIQIMANRLERLTCLEFIPNPTHQRSKLLQITDRGVALLAVRLEEDNELLDSLTPHFPEAEVAAGLDFLQRLRLAVTSGPGNGKTSSVAAAAPVPRPRLKTHPPHLGQEEPQEDENSLPYNLL